MDSSQEEETLSQGSLNTFEDSKGLTRTVGQKDMTTELQWAAGYPEINWFKKWYQTHDDDVVMEGISDLKSREAMKR